MGVIAMVALAFTSCKKNEEPATMFYATVADLVEEEGERAYIGNGNLTNFEVGDRVMLYNINNTDAGQSSYASYTATATGLVVTCNDPNGMIGNTRQDAFFAYYPGDYVSNSSLAINNEAMFYIPNTQTYRELDGTAVVPARALTLAAKDAKNTQVNNAHFTFQQIMGVVRLKLTDANNRTVTSIVYEDNAMNVTGRVHLRIHEVDPTEMNALFNQYSDLANPPAGLSDYIQRVGYMVDGTADYPKGNTITLDCGEGVQLGSTVKPFYIALRPLAMLGGCTITVNFSDGTSAVIDGSSFSKVKPGVIKNITRELSTL